jgi:hypothetical protein
MKECRKQSASVVLSSPVLGHLDVFRANVPEWKKAELHDIETRTVMAHINN